MSKERRMLHVSEGSIDLNSVGGIEISKGHALTDIEPPSIKIGTLWTGDDGAEVINKLQDLNWYDDPRQAAAHKKTVELYRVEYEANLKNKAD